MIAQKLTNRMALNIGMISLFAALILPRLAGSAGSFSPDLIDGIQGLFFGLSFGFNLLWVSRISRQRRGEGQ